MTPNAGDGGVRGAPRLLLRLEGLAVFLAALVVYEATGASWWLFVILFLAPDLSMLGYLVTPIAGAAAYNAVHTYVLAFALALAAHIWRLPALDSLALVLAAHIGLDRAIGYGLKYPTRFGATHLGLLGRRD